MCTLRLCACTRGVPGDLAERGESDTRRSRPLRSRQRRRWLSELVLYKHREPCAAGREKKLSDPRRAMPTQSSPSHSSRCDALRAGRLLPRERRLRTCALQVLTAGSFIPKDVIIREIRVEREPWRSRRSRRRDRNVTPGRYWPDVGRRWPDVGRRWPGVTFLPKRALPIWRCTGNSWSNCGYSRQIIYLMGGLLKMIICSRRTTIYFILRNVGLNETNDCFRGINNPPSSKVIFRFRLKLLWLLQPM